MSTGLGALFASESVKAPVNLIVLTGKANTSLVTRDPQLRVCAKAAARLASTSALLR